MTNCNCGCEAFYNYEGMCKHCVAMLLNYKQENSNGDSQVKTGTGTETPEAGEHPVGKMETAAPLKKSAEPVFHACNVQIYVAGNHLRKSRVRTLL